MKLTIWMLKTNKQITRLKISEKRKHFTFNGGKYIIEPEAINSFARIISKKTKNKNTNKTKTIETVNQISSEILYFEGSSTPIALEESIDSLDSSLKYLNDYIAQNALKQTGDIAGLGIESTFGVLKDIFTIQNIAKFGLVVLIGGSIIWGYLVDYGII